jgi:hypothetical protein
VGDGVSDLAWPGLSQVCRLVHQTQRRERWHTQVHYKITNLSRERAGPAGLLRFNRGHWAIETNCIMCATSHSGKMPVGSGSALRHKPWSPCVISSWPCCSNTDAPIGRLVCGISPGAPTGRFKRSD